MLLLCLMVLPHRLAYAQAADNESMFAETELMFIGEDLRMVSIASRKAEPLRRAPAAVKVIEGAELTKYRTLAEVLRRVPGFFVDRNELKERIYLRGIPDSFLVMMDGVPFASDASTIDYPRGMELSLDYIDKIEIIRGPGSALWGPDAFSGIINLVTKKGKKAKGITVKGETGSYDTRGTALQGGFEKGGWDGFAYGSGSSSEGFEKDLPADNDRRRDDRYGEAYARLSYKDLFELSGRYSRYRDYYSIPSYLVQGSQHKAFSFVQATVNKSFGEASVSLQGWFQYFDGLDDYQRTRYEQINRQYGTELKYDQPLFGNNFLTMGASYRYNDGGTTRLKFSDLSAEYFPNYDTHLSSGYLQDKWKITENLEATAGVRYDYHSEYENFTSPRFGVSYQFLQYFSAKLLYGRAFRTPSLAVVIEEQGLDPEKIDSYEAVLGFNYKNLISLEANYFYNELDDIIERNALNKIGNSGSENIKGVELSLNVQPLKDLSLYTAYSHLLGSRQKGLRATQEVPSEEDPNQTVESTLESFINVAPATTVSCGVDYGFWKHFRINLELNYADKRRLARGGEELYGGRKRLSSYLLWDLNLFITDLPLHGTELALKIKNLTDKDYDTRGVFGLVDGEGSSMYLMLRHSF
jgi:outer membrane cobalamin receptor